MAKKILMVVGLWAVVSAFQLSPFPFGQSNGYTETAQNTPVFVTGQDYSSGTLSLITYNTAGLPYPAYRMNDAERNHSVAARLLAGYDPDIILFQEDFAFHEHLLHSLKDYPYKSASDFSKYSNKIGVTDQTWQVFAQAGLLIVGNLIELLHNTNDGLNRFSKVFFSPPNLYREKWAECSNMVSFDCMAPKGFSMGVHYIAPGKKVFVYNLHHDAGETTGDWQARRVQFKQIINHIAKYASDTPVIIGGDFNLDLDNSQDRALYQELMETHKLQDACLAYQNTDSLPKCNNLDRFLFRGDKTLGWHTEHFEIINGFINKYSDHAPVWVKLKWTQKL